ncbi:hypothetical protein B0I35DRAFT_409721 [Stachybotrys elegans]|uniref:Zinc finger PHD-type domain-containing protein n=1 Tax=Stachybotrys elegans TaxID=80388 RepID=A0A8K0WQU8_9HYPO|nr:hypothetical protein B0I35DRAFT_409721 [Stachybotrys elegans]
MSGRPERNTRSLNKPSSGKSTPSASLSSEPLDDLDDTLLSRRRKRGQDDEQDKIPRPDALFMANGSDDLQEDEDEAVRCICGSEDYPGPPPADSPDADIFVAVEFTEDVTGFFVQCDICKVWQHGACVGIFSAESSPDEYFCELCRKELHKILLASNGQKYSKYLPLHRGSRTTSRATSLVKDAARSPKIGATKNSRQNSASQASKRRSTMNSRDAAYDDEQLRRAIEASKEEVVQESIENGSRRTKRGRSDSEENITNIVSIKRQRTSSRSASPPADPPEAASHEESEDENGLRNGSKKLRNGRSQREKSAKDDKERLRQEAANKRKGRADRRRGEDSDVSEETPLAVSKPPRNKSVEPPSAAETPAPAQPTPGTPPATHPTVGSSHKRGARSNHKKGKAKTPLLKDLDGDKDESPARSMSRDIARTAEEAPTTAQPKHSTNDHKNTSKAKAAMATKMSMSDMKRRVAAIMDFISRTQVDLAAEASPSQSGGPSSRQESPQKTDGPSHTNGSLETRSAVGSSRGTPTESSHDKDFKDLNCIEMMDVLTRDMVRWQNQYAL